MDGLEPAQVEALLADIDAMPGVESVEYVSPETAMDRLEQAYADRGQILDTGGAEISLYASVEVSLTDPSAGAAVGEALREREEIEVITTRQEQYDKHLASLSDVAANAEKLEVVQPGEEFEEPETEENENE